MRTTLRRAIQGNLTEHRPDLYIVVIWNSVAIMTITDIAIIGGVGYALNFLISRWRRANDPALRTGFFAIIGGFGVMASFHAIDLIVRYVSILDFAPQIAQDTRLITYSLFTLASFGSVVFGLTKLGRSICAKFEEQTVSNKLAMAALQKSELHFRHLVEGSLQGISISDGEKRLFVNQAYADMLGYGSPEDVMEQLPYLQPFMSTEKKDVQTRVQDRLNHGGQGHPFETEMVRKDGATINVLIMVKAIEWRGRAAVLATLVDITERKHREQALTESHKLLQSLIDGIPEFVALKNANDEYLFVNRVFEQWYDVPREQAIGTTLNDYHPSQIAKALTAQEHDAIEKRSPQSVECEAAWPDGNVRRTIDTRFPVFDEHGKIVARGIIARDVTELRRTELNLRQAQKMEAIGQLTGGIAHDFNNMLAVILGNLELATLTLEKNHPAIRYLQPAMMASDRGATLTQRLLSFARKQPLQVTTVDLRDLVTDLKDMLRQTLGKQIDVEVLNPAGLWSCAVDAAQLEQALLNLALNARDAMPQGGKLTMQTENVCLDQNFAEENSIEPGHYVVITVSDTGCGLPPDTEEQIFEPFFTTKEVGQGTGLGLSMVWGFVKQSRGHVTVHSVPDEGTTFRLYLPRSSADAEIDNPSRRPSMHRSGPVRFEPSQLFTGTRGR